MNIKMAHITDLHLRNRIPGPANIPGRRGRELYRRIPELVEKINSLSVDIVVITGDVLDVPRWFIKEGFYYDYDFSFWEQMIYLDYLSIQAEFKKCDCPVLFLPGNHDHPQLFRRVFGRQLEPLKVKDFTFYAFSDWPFRGSRGRRLDLERKLFDSCLSEGPDNQIHCQHYVIAPRIDSQYPYNYLEYRELYQRIVNSQKVRLCLSGHYHQGAELNIQNTSGTGEIQFYTGKSLSELPFPFYVYEITKSEVLKTNYQLDENRKKKKAIFLDRDGCITESPSYNSGPNEIRLIKGVGEALAEFQKLGYALVVISDQTAVGKGYVLKDTVHWVNDELSRQLDAFGVEIDGFYFSMGAGKEAVSREYAHQIGKKPSPDFIYLAEKELHLDLAQSVFVGDRLSDCLCGLEASLPTYLVRTGYGKTEEQKIYSSKSIAAVNELAEVVKILSHSLKKH